MLKRLRLAWGRRYFYLNRIWPVEVPVHNLSWTPDRFRVRQIARTGVRLVDDFCTEDDAAGLIDRARQSLTEGSDALTVDLQDDEVLQPVLYRCSMVFGVPYTHVERVVLVRCTDSTAESRLSDLAPIMTGQRQHGLLLTLNAGSETVFRDLNLAVAARAGRAVCWTRSGDNADLLTPALRAPDVSDGAAWVLQVWLNEKPQRDAVHNTANQPQARKGSPLDGTESTPEGVWAPEQIDLEGVFGKPDKLKDLV